MAWFYSDNGLRQGPVTDSEFLAMINSGQVRGETLVWQEGMPDWQALQAVRPDLLGGGAMVPAGAAAVMQKDLEIQRAREGVQAAGTFEYAGFWIRLVAIIIDGLVLMPLMFVIALPMGLFAGVAQEMESDTAAVAALGGQLLMQLVLYAIVILYNGFMVGKFGWTLGKKALGLRVVAPDGSPVSMGRAFGRAFAEILSGMICNIGYIIAAFDSEKRSLHDHIASTRVIKG